jgi:hypothetical protein
MRIPGAVAFAMLMVLAVSDSTQALCVELPQSLADDYVSLVFQGTVTDRQPVTLPRRWGYGATVTFEVTRVWKGQVGKIVRVNVAESLEGFPLGLHKEYLVIATLQSARERQLWSVPPDAEATFGTSGCRTLPIESPTAQKFIAGAPGGPPR